MQACGDSQHHLVAMVNSTSIGSPAYWSVIIVALIVIIIGTYGCTVPLMSLLNTAGSHASSGQACPARNDVPLPTNLYVQIFLFLFFWLLTNTLLIFSMRQRRRRQLRVFNRDSGNSWLLRVTPKAWAPALGSTPTGSSWGKKEPMTRRRRELCCCSCGPPRWVRYERNLMLFMRFFFFSPWILKKRNRSTIDSETLEGAIFRCICLWLEKPW